MWQLRRRDQSLVPTSRINKHAHHQRRSPLLGERPASSRGAPPRPGPAGVPNGEERVCTWGSKRRAPSSPATPPQVPATPITTWVRRLVSLALHVPFSRPNELEAAASLLCPARHRSGRQLAMKSLSVPARDSSDGGLWKLSLLSVILKAESPGRCSRWYLAFLAVVPTQDTLNVSGRRKTPETVYSPSIVLYSGGKCGSGER